MDSYVTVGGKDKADAWPNLQASNIRNHQQQKNRSDQREMIDYNDGA